MARLTCSRRLDRPRADCTTLSTIYSSVILGGLAVGLLNFGNDKVGKISAAMFTIVGERSQAPLA